MRYLIILLTLFLGACASSGPKQFAKGDYDDPTDTNLLDDKFNEADMQTLADTMIKSMASCGYIAKADKPPVVIMGSIQNKTDEHIDTAAVTDMIRTALIKGGRVRFINKEERENIQSEYEYDAAGNVAGPSAKKGGEQVGADYVFSGALATNIQEVGADKLVYYKLTGNLTNVTTSVIDCSEEKQIRKVYEKRSIASE